MVNKAIVLVDPCSSRLNFIDEIAKAEYTPVCVFPFHRYENTFESMQYKNEVSTIMSLCIEKGTVVIEAPENLDDILPSLKEYEIVGVINCSDDATHVSDLLAEKLGCPLNPSETSNIRMDKADMQHAIAQKGFRSIRTMVVNSEEDIKRFWCNNGLDSAVVKPTRSGGMKGVYYCTTENDAFNAFYSLKNETNQVGEKNDRIIIQECINGSHYFYNTISIDGNHRVMQAWVVSMQKMADGITTMIYTSIPVNPVGFRGLTKYLFEVLDALEFRNGLAQTEIMVDKEGPVLMEINPRMMKFYVTPENQDKTFGNHNSDVAMMAITDPKGFLENWKADINVKSLMIKRLTSYVEGIRYAKPAEVLLSLSKGIIQVDMNVPLDMPFDMKKTEDLSHSPGSVQIFSRDPVTLHYMVTDVNIIERRFPDLLWDTVERHESCGFTSDVNEVASEIGSDAVSILNDASILEWKEGKYGSADEEKKYNCGVIVLGGSYKLDERYNQLRQFYDSIRDGGIIYALRSSYENMPYGEIGMETVLSLFGGTILPPKNSGDDVIRCVVNH